MIPTRWSNNFHYFITYFGDVYYGIAVDLDFSSEDFYIIGKNQFREYQALNTERFQREKLDKIGVHISSKRIIQKVLSEEEFPGFETSHPPIFWRGNSSDYKKMYVFGAGASSFCQFGNGEEKLKEFQFRPPLGPDLFAERFNAIVMKYPGLQLILPKFESRGNDIEAILEDDWNYLIGDLNKELASQHVQLQFFLREVFQRISTIVDRDFFRYNLYTLFAQQLIKEWKPDNRPTIVSFNYDTLLDRAFEKQLRIDFNDINSYIDQGEDSRLVFLKPHGSWNWGWEFDGAVIKDELTNVADWLYRKRVTPAEIYYNMLGEDMLTSKSWGMEAQNHPNRIGRITPNKDKIKVWSGDLMYFPALLLPYRDKDEFVMPYNHQLKLEVILPQIEELILIGWKGNEKLFNTKLKDKARKLKRIVIVNPDADAVRNELGKYLDLNNYDVENKDTFKDFVLNQMI